MMSQTKNIYKFLSAKRVYRSPVIFIYTVYMSVYIGYVLL